MLKLLLTAALLFFQQSVTNPNPPVTSEDDDVEYICPMDKNVRQKTPGKCPICGMTLVLGIPDAHEYPVRISTKPKMIKPGEDTLLNFKIEEPDNGKTVQDFEVMHEKLYHLFLVSQDMRFFRHIHPEKQPDGTFNLDVKFPHAGLYRVLSDFYPKGGTPQLIASTMMIPGAGFRLEPAKLAPDLKPQKSENLDVELVLDPPEPLAGFKTLMFFKLKPNDGIEPYLGAMGHMLAASSDLIDLMHTHPLYVTDPDEGAYKQIQFNLIFPRAGIYRVWVQFQRKGVVNTVAFNVPVKPLD
ncbi:MAG TPA: heavy metal-binding domain-containing protein [Bryobacteraceae bacterium]|nr:heavy metal-binding domain-containing protein [Bryobacteraceae bacterium]